MMVVNITMIILCFRINKYILNVHSLFMFAIHVKLQKILIFDKVDKSTDSFPILLYYKL